MRNLYKFIEQIGTEYLNDGDKEVSYAEFWQEVRREGFTEERFKLRLKEVAHDMGWVVYPNKIKFV